MQASPAVFCCQSLISRQYIGKMHYATKDLFRSKTIDPLSGKKELFLPGWLLPGCIAGVEQAVGLGLARCLEVLVIEHLADRALV